MLFKRELLAQSGSALRAEKALKLRAAPLALLLLAGCESAPPAGLADAASAPAAVAAPASAPKPAASAARAAGPTQSNGFTVRWLRPDERAEADGVEAVREGWGRGVRLVVTSSAGIGHAEVQPARGVWPRQVQVQFQYAADRPFTELEGLRLQVGNPAHNAGDEVPPLVPDGFVVWQRDGTLRVALPEGWLRDRQSLRIAWVDRYRR